MGNILKLDNLVIMRLEDFETLVKQLQILNRDTMPRSDSINGISSVTIVWTTIRKLLELE
jgi:hypothetical protein